MPLVFKPNTRYRMPVAFGPMPGPRQRIGGGRYDDTMVRVQVVTSSFLTDPAHLERLLPSGFSLDGEPIVTVEIAYLTEVYWLAGRGYATLGVRFPTRYTGHTETVRGPFLAVLWENKADPIITGREELGYAKIFCDIHPPALRGDHRRYTASWEGHEFMEMELSGVCAANPSPPPAIDGILHYKYMPRTGSPGEADFANATISPVGAHVELIDYAEAHGAVRFHQSTWEQLPTLMHIVNILAALPILEERRATVTNLRADGELDSQRIVG